MSWDVDIHLNYCPHCGRGDEVAGWNYTSNMWPMLQDVGFSWDSIHGKTTKEAAPLLDALIVALEADPEKYRAMNPDNKWGDYDRFLDRLRHLLHSMSSRDGVVLFCG